MNASNTDFLKRMNTALGIDLGGSSIKTVVVNATGQLLAQTHCPFDSAEPMNWAEKLRSLVQQRREEGPSFGCIGLSAPGLAAADGRAIAYLPKRLEGLQGLNWTRYLNASSPIPVLNDGHAALVGESWLGAARDFRNVILITLGTGVGGAAIVDGRLLRGQIGRAGHLGHCSLDPDGAPDICGTPGSLEVAIGNCTIETRSQGRYHSTHELIEAYSKGDPEAAVIWRRSVKALAAAICSFINILDPEAVIVGGGISRAGKALFDPLREFIDPLEWRPGGQQVKILSAQLGDLAGAYGAAYHALKLYGADSAASSP